VVAQRWRGSVWRCWAWFGQSENRDGVGGVYDAMKMNWGKGKLPKKRSREAFELSALDRTKVCSIALEQGRA
jgi:hypothetical protein